jgi:hypothetical protein
MIFLLTLPVFGQPPSAAPVTDKPKPIQDNSFLLEEAYNQEWGVVQHISSFIRQRNGDWVYAFTQEWPVPGQKHQFSFTIPVQAVDSEGRTSRGFSDVALNYRYQLVGSGETRVAVAPRFSILFPTGDEQRALGEGATGYQFNFPVSIAVSDSLVAHSNAGVTFTPSARNLRREEANLTDYNLGQSLIWLAHPRFNVMFEMVWLNQQSVIAPRRTSRDDTLLLSPGIRWAHNFKSGLQIVPGIAVPLGVGPSKGERGILLYLSFEHPFRRARSD